jgi:deoxyribodipyrimidine photolyase-related protein
VATVDRSVKRLRLILGDQLHADSPQLAGFDPAGDLLVMIEAPGEATAVWSHKARIALFLAAMRHYAAGWRERGLPLVYLELDDPAYADCPALADRLERLIDTHRPAELVVIEPGEWRLAQALRALAARRGLRLTELPDSHFLCSRADFAAWAGRKNSLRMEFFYRWMRQRHKTLLERDGTPAGGQWNFDADNRRPYPRQGPGLIPPPARFEPDETTRAVLALVQRHFGDHPGRLEHFGWPVTRAQALHALQVFIDERLPQFGPYQDAMWTDTPWGWHALLSASLNLKLLDPREVIAAAESAWRAGRAPLASVEGFVRQILGWREFIRGVYWHFMPQLRQANFYNHQRSLPRWYWTAETKMACMRACIGQTLDYGFAHHIQRLMVTGQFALLAQIEPQQVADWYLAVYVDAVEWVELPNVAGMALFADGGRFTSKPYIASGKYIERQSNYCRHCEYRPEQKSGAAACPVTVLYWAFLDRHHEALARNPRTRLMAASVARLDAEQRQALRSTAARMLDNLDAL